MQRLRVTLTGAVQGVGFRPFVYRLATSLRLNGWVLNSTSGLTVEVEGEPAILDMLERLKANRDFCLEALRGMPRVTIPNPDGAFYLFPRIEGLSDSFEFCRRLLMETRVGLAPGVAFGAGGEGSVRICYAADRSILEPAMERLGEYLRRSL